MNPTDNSRRDGEVGVFGRGGEAGAGFGGKFIVGMDGRTGIATTERADEPTERLALLGSPRVGGIAVGIKPADVDHADTLGILALAMRSNLLNRTTDGDTAVKPDDVVVADATESARTMPRINFSDTHSATDSGRRAMNNDFCDFSHSNVSDVLCVFFIDFQFLKPLFFISTRGYANPSVNFRRCKDNTKISRKGAIMSKSVNFFSLGHKKSVPRLTVKYAEENFLIYI